MTHGPLQRALSALVRPLAFAAGNDFANLQKLPDLEADVRRACDAALALGLPSDLRRDLEEVAQLFSKPLCEEERIDCVRRTLALLAPCQSVGWENDLLSRSVLTLPGVGPKREQAFAKRGLATVGDMIFFLPARYEDRRSLAQIADLEVGRRATFLAEVESVEGSTHRAPRRFTRVLLARVGDESGSVILKWFRVPEGVEALLKTGTRLLVTGDVKRYRFSKELVHPEIDRVDTVATESAEAGEGGLAEAMGHLRRIVPDYGTPEGIPPRTLRRLIQGAVAEYADVVPGFLPQKLVQGRALPEPAAALRAIHAPDPETDLELYTRFASVAHDRLVLEELYLLQLGLLMRRDARAREAAPVIAVDGALQERLCRALPFALTGAQSRAWGEICRDLSEPHPMSRLLQGDVGSGKTAVALLAVLAVAAAGYQSALMAPTELLAEQHLRTLRGLTEGTDAPPLRIALLTSSLPKGEQSALLAALAAGEIDLVVGTHALVQQGVRFERLALSIVDEQHRFGVRQRVALGEKAGLELRPHTLVMTATPIPRTLALSLYGDLDVSVIDELPPGRSPVETLLLRKGEGQRVMELVRATAQRGEQIYVVYPLVEESEKVDLRSAIESARRIRAGFPEQSVDLVHGRLDASARGEAMARFARGDTDILVSTTVIEVGVDIPNATLMVIEHAERFGLAQLHQLRGRVGRGQRPGTCVMVARGGSADGEARLRAMLRSNDGFEIAEADLRIRGPGEFLGTRQSGHLPSFQIVDLLRDARLISAAREAARETLREDPGLRGQPELMAAVKGRWGDRLALLAGG